MCEIMNRRHLRNSSKSYKCIMYGITNRLHLGNPGTTYEDISVNNVWNNE